MSKIPTISNERLNGLVKKIKPVIRAAKISTSKGTRLEEYKEGDLYFIKPVNPRDVAFTWEPKPTRRARRVNPIPYKTIGTLHTYGAPVFFKPSIAEVLSQIPEEDLDRCVAFETCYLKFAENNLYHEAKTRLYEKR
jgi:hypothetical protein